MRSHGGSRDRALLQGMLLLPSALACMSPPLFWDSSELPGPWTSRRVKKAPLHHHHHASPGLLASMLIRKSATHQQDPVGIQRQDAPPQKAAAPHCRVCLPILYKINLSTFKFQQHVPLIHTLQSYTAGEQDNTKTDAIALSVSEVMTLHLAQSNASRSIQARCKFQAQTNASTELQHQPFLQQLLPYSNNPWSWRSFQVHIVLSPASFIILIYRW